MINLNNRKSIYTALIILSIKLLGSCEITEDLDDYKTLYSLEAETAISNETTAELALTGVYSWFVAIPPQMFFMSDVCSGYAQARAGSTSNPETSGWVFNRPAVVNAQNQSLIYANLYSLINRSNWIIKSVPQLKDNVFKNSNRKTEIVGEARALRALAYFYLLRNFGQFYDVNSQYGLNIRTTPVEGVKSFPRNSVAETYDAIIADLDQAMETAPDFRTKFYVNKTFAKALKAKVLMYKGDYGQAAALAAETIAGFDSNFQLEPDYAFIFDQGDSPERFNSSEIIFGTKGDPDRQLFIGNYYSGSVAVSPKYIETVQGALDINGQSVTIDNYRSSAVFFLNPEVPSVYYTSKYFSFFTNASYDMINHMRVAELYLILAESSARAAHAVTSEALEALNTIRLRAGAEDSAGDGFVVYPASISYNQFLTAVRMEKLAELQTEGGESWFDLIRYDYADGFGEGFQVSDVKATATNPDKFILPIPKESIDASNKIVVQNPSY